MLFEGTAWAQAAAPAAGSPSIVEQLMTGPGPIMALVIAVMYFLVFRPQNKKAQEQAKLLNSLKRNDEVVTTGGIIGRIAEVGDKVIILEIELRQDHVLEKGRQVGTYRNRKNSKWKHRLKVSAPSSFCWC